MYANPFIKDHFDDAMRDLSTKRIAELEAENATLKKELSDIRLKKKIKKLLRETKEITRLASFAFGIPIDAPKNEGE